jgi:hypothetical protein
VNAGDEITLRCMTASNLQPATVMLYYKISAAPEFEVARMSKEGASGDSTAWVAKIPAPRTQGTSLLFYFEANDPSGNTLAQAGSEESPNTIAVKGGEAALGAGPPPVSEEEYEEEEEEDWDEEEIDDDNPLAILERERWREHEGSRGSWWISLGVGSGLGYAAGHATEAFHKYGVGFNPGIAPATTGQAVLEFGYFVGRQTALAITAATRAFSAACRGRPPAPTVSFCVRCSSRRTAGRCAGILLSRVAGARASAFRSRRMCVTLMATPRDRRSRIPSAVALSWRASGAACTTGLPGAGDGRSTPRFCSGSPTPLPCST